MRIIQVLRAPPLPAGAAAVYSPVIRIHFEERTVAGKGIAKKVYGDMKVAAGEYVYARELELNTLKCLVLTPEVGFYNGLGYMAQKTIVTPGALDNYASIDVFDDASTWQSPGVGPVDGSIWLNFVAMGE